MTRKVSPFSLGHGFLLGLVAATLSCASAAPSDPSVVTAPSTSARALPTAFAATAEEQAACGKKVPEKLDSLTCLVAVQKRKWSGDAEGASRLLALGCDQGDFDACLDLAAAARAAGDEARSTALSTKVAAACDALGARGKNLAVCLRGRTTDVLELEGVPARLPIALALDLRASEGPKLLALRQVAEEGCPARNKGTPDALKSLGFMGTPLEHDASVVDAAAMCRADLAERPQWPVAVGVTIDSDLAVRSLHDSILAPVSTLKIAAGADRSEVGVWCPSHLVDDDSVADVFARFPAPGMKDAFLVTTVRLREPCVSAAAMKVKADDRAFIARAYAPIETTVQNALVKLAARCDRGAADFDPKRSPLAGDPIETDPAVVGVAAACQLGFHAFYFPSKKPLAYPSALSQSSEVVKAGGRTVKVTETKEIPGRLDLTFRLRDAELVVGVKRP